MVLPWHAAHSPVFLEGLTALFVVLFLLVKEGVPGFHLGKLPGNSPWATEGLMRQVEI